MIRSRESLARFDIEYNVRPSVSFHRNRLLLFYDDCVSITVYVGM